MLNYVPYTENNSENQGVLEMQGSSLLPAKRSTSASWAMPRNNENNDAPQGFPIYAILG